MLDSSYGFAWSLSWDSRYCCHSVIGNSEVFAPASNVCTCAISALDVFSLELLGVHLRDVGTRDCWKQTGHGGFLFQNVPSVSFESGDQLRNLGQE